MDGKGSYNDNLFIERLWRKMKYEGVYLKAYQGGREARIGLGNYFRFYNTERPHHDPPPKNIDIISRKVSNNAIMYVRQLREKLDISRDTLAREPRVLVPRVGSPDRNRASGIFPIY